MQTCVVFLSGLLYIKHCQYILLMTVTTWLSFPVTCPHFVYLWFIEQMLGLLSL